ncbi:tetratricopeptide repeat protein [Amycolatopsis lexingtonensis]|uniref:tetratricopeptide repeat protein n=1 Tax=Amycolatopsis lexingtonensis TaxID=218822 RepID=UPI003F6F3726
MLTDGDPMQVHRDVRSLLRGEMADPERVCRTARDLLGTAVAADPDRPGSWPVYRLLATDVRMVLALMDRTTVESHEPEAFRAFLLRVLRYLFVSGQHQVGATTGRTVHRSWTAALGADHPDTLAAANRLGASLFGLGKFEGARALFEDALGRSRQVLGPGHPLSVVLAGNLSGSLIELAEHEAARALDEDTVRVSRQVLGEDHPDTLRVAGSLAVSLFWCAEYETARALNEDTLRRYQQVLGADHPDTLAAAVNLAVIFRTLERYEEARALTEDTLRRRERVLGADHRDTLASAACLASDEDRIRRGADDPSSTRAIARFRQLRRDLDAMLAAAEKGAAVPVADERALDLSRRAKDFTQRDDVRMPAALELAKLTGHEAEGARLLIGFAVNRAFVVHQRLDAAVALAELDGFREGGAGLLAHLADDTSFEEVYRVYAAAALARVDGYADVGAGLLTRLADDRAVDEVTREYAASDLAKVRGYEAEGVTLLIGFANDTALESRTRLYAAGAVARVDGYANEGVELLTRLATDTTFDGRVSAAAKLRVVGFREESARLLLQLATDTTFGARARVDAARFLCGCDENERQRDGVCQAGEKEAWEELDPALAGGGHEAEGVRILLDLSRDTAFPERSYATYELKWVLTQRALRNPENWRPEW